MYRYRGITEAAEPVTGVIEAQADTDALQKLQDRRIDVTELKAIKPKSVSLSRKKPGSTDYYNLLEQLAVLVNSGIPVLEAIESLRKTSRNFTLTEQLDRIGKELRQGVRLSQAMMDSMPNLPPMVPALVALGEQTGNLDDVLSSIGKQLGKQEKMKSELRNAFTYPIFLSVVGVGAVLFLFLFVVPRFSAMIGDDLSALPFIAQAVFHISAFLTERWPVALMILFLVVFGIAAIWSSKQARSSVIGMIHYVPVIGPILRQSELANWTRTVGLAFSARANLITAVTLAENTVTSDTNRAAFGDVARDLRAGMALDDALEKVPGIEPVVVNLVSTGVRAGRLGEMLMVATRILDERVEAGSNRLSRLAEPIAILIISALVGMVVIGLVMAMTSLYEFSL